MDRTSFAAGRLPLAALVLLYLTAVGVYILLGSEQLLPQVAPDEYTYSALARSLAAGDGLTWRGGSAGIRAALYIYAIAPAWLVTGNLVHAYAVAKAIGAALVCTVVFPTWLLARRSLPPLAALIPAVLIVAGSWMTQSGQMITENLALPLATAALAALVVAVVRPGSRWGWIALGFAALATWSRMQLAVLIPVIFLVLAVDAATERGHGRQRLRGNAWIIATSGLIAFAGGVIVLARPSVLGVYGGLRAQTDLGAGIPLLGRQSLAFVAMAGVLPFILALAITARRDARRAAEIRALLLVLWTATLVVIVQSGLLSTAFDVTWSIQRYVEYGLPVLYVLVIAGLWHGLVSWRLVAGATLLVAGCLLLTPDIQNIQEQRGLFGIIRRGDELLGASPGLAMALVALVTGGVMAAAVALAGRSRNARALLLGVAIGLTAVVFAVQDQAGWHWQQTQSAVWRAGFPKDLSWIDHASDGPVARLVTSYNPFKSPQTEFFNKRLTRVYAPSSPVGGTRIGGRTCRWGADPAGTLLFGTACGPVPTRFLLNDDQAKTTFYGQRVIDDQPLIGRLVDVPLDRSGRQRLRASIVPPCLAPIATQNPRTGHITPPRATCFSRTSGTLYLDAPAMLVMRFRGGLRDQVLRVTGAWDHVPHAYTIPKGTTSALRLAVPAGTQRYSAALGWAGSPPSIPQLTSVELEQRGTRTELLY